MRLENEAEARPLRGLQTVLMVERHLVDTGFYRRILKQDF